MKTTPRTNDDSQARSGNLPPATTAEKTAKVEICHPSVCVGGVIPTNCVCPTTPKK